MKADQCSIVTVRLFIFVFSGRNWSKLEQRPRCYFLIILQIFFFCILHCNQPTLLTHKTVTYSYVFVIKRCSGLIKPIQFNKTNALFCTMFVLQMQVIFYTYRTTISELIILAIFVKKPYLLDGRSPTIIRSKKIAHKRPSVMLPTWNKVSPWRSTHGSNVTMSRYPVLHISKFSGDTTKVGHTDCD